MIARIGARLRSLARPAEGPLDARGVSEHETSESAQQQPAAPLQVARSVASSLGRAEASASLDPRRAADAVASVG